MLIYQVFPLSRAALQKSSLGISLLVVLFVGPFSCTTFSPPIENQRPESQDFQLQVFSDDAALDAYLEKLDALHSEWRAFYREKQEAAQKALATQQAKKADSDAPIAVSSYSASSRVRGRHAFSGRGHKSDFPSWTLHGFGSIERPTFDWTLKAASGQLLTDSIRKAIYNRMHCLNPEPC